MAKTFSVVVTRVNEGEHQREQEAFEALSVSVDEDGRVDVRTKTGGANFSSTGWGSVTITRVPGR